ncbi:NERD domain-containing protein [Psychromonas hadalis]|uniref:NERD domain-containing protein n=1 Tax=Psychromonas hadalis TaxID=211669 RepID=UPI0003B3743F|nr:NERD domain-containing protein [Psychromonas hadalis]
MDLKALIINALGIYWFLIPLFFLPLVLKSAWFKGVFGEFLVNFLLTKFLEKDQYTLIKNVTLATENGTTQIDHIVVSPFGVFVIETKNMKGWIFGSAKQKQWTQKIFKYSGKFQNPLHQNYKHTQTLASCLNLPSDQIYSVIVFIGDSTFKTEMPQNVTYARGCVEYIKTKQELHFTPEQVNEIVKSIEAGRLSRGLKTNLAHNKHVKSIIKGTAFVEPTSDATLEAVLEPMFQTRLETSPKTQQSFETACPKCGSEMVLREAKKGKNAGNQFYGCSAFPKCRKILSIS